MRLKTAAAALHVLSLNAAGIPFVHPGLSARLPAIAAHVKQAGYDVVALQELWRDEDARALADAAGLAYRARVPRSVLLGTGLAILSRYPIEATRERHFTCSPSIFRLTQGEAFARKGVLMARVETPRGALDVYDLHLVSDYPGSRYFTLRLTQVFEAAQAVERWSRGRPFVILGDLNASPSDPEYRAFIDLLGLQDACLSPGGDDDCGVTDDEDDKRIDGVFLPQGRRRAARARAVLTEPIPGTNLRYSDHEGVAAELGPAVLRRRLDPDRSRRLDALMHIEAAVERMEQELSDRRADRSWIPLYGLIIDWRYARQIAQLDAVRERVETARVLAVEGRDPSSLAP